MFFSSDKSSWNRFDDSKFIFGWSATWKKFKISCRRRTKICLAIDKWSSAEWKLERIWCKQNKIVIMPCWYYEKRDLRCTPSIQSGMEYEGESRYRKEGVRFIMQCGTEMSLGHNTIATGAVYFHRFYMFHTFQEFPRYVTACCCLFLAGKVEETPKKCRDIISIARTILSSDVKFQTFSEDLRKAKEEVMTLESILLQTIKFDLEVEHPYNFLLSYAKCLKGDKVKLQKMVQMAWNFVNDSLSTTVCLQWEPEIIAVALIHLASKLSKFTVSDWTGRQSHHLRWWDMFIADVTMEILEDICHQVLDLYQPNQQIVSNDSPPMAGNTSRQNKSPIAAKRSRNSPLHKPASPNVAAQAVTPPTSQMPPAKMSTGDMNHPMPPVPQMTCDNMHYAAYQSAYGAMYPHASHYAPPPPPMPNMPSTPMTSHIYPMAPSAHMYPQPPMPPMMPVHTSSQPQPPPPSVHYYNHPPPNRLSGFYSGAQWPIVRSSILVCFCLQMKWNLLKLIVKKTVNS